MRDHARRWYKVRGVAESFLPRGLLREACARIAAAATERSRSPRRGVPTGADDTDGDGIPGAAFTLAGIVSGIRNEAQRDWKEYATASRRPRAAGALTFAVPARSILQQNVASRHAVWLWLRARRVGRAPRRDRTPRVTLSFIGKTLGKSSASPRSSPARRAGAWT